MKVDLSKYVPYLAQLLELYLVAEMVIAVPSDCYCDFDNVCRPCMENREHLGLRVMGLRRDFSEAGLTIEGAPS